jgi:hypothetical protein
MLNGLVEGELPVLFATSLSQIAHHFEVMHNQTVGPFLEECAPCKTEKKDEEMSGS